MARSERAGDVSPTGWPFERTSMVSFVTFNRNAIRRDATAHFLANAQGVLHVTVGGASTVALRPTRLGTGLVRNSSCNVGVGSGDFEIQSDCSVQRVIAKSDISTSTPPARIQPSDASASRRSTGSPTDGSPSAQPAEQATTTIAIVVNCDSNARTGTHHALSASLVSVCCSRYHASKSTAECPAAC